MGAAVEVGAWLVYIGFIIWALVVAWGSRTSRAWGLAFGRIFFVSLVAWIATGAWIDTKAWNSGTDRFAAMNRWSARVVLGSLASLAVILILQVLRDRESSPQ